MLPGQRPRRALWSWIGAATLALAALLLHAACARVDPRMDYAGAGEQIRERIGVQEVYDPAEDRAVEVRIEQLLAEGLSIEGAVQIALLNNRAFQSAFLEIGVSRADLVQSALLQNPTLTLGARFIESGGRAEITLGFIQNLVDLWQIPIRKRIAAAHLEAIVLSIVRRAIDLRADVKTRCYQLLALRRAEATAAETLDVARESVRVARARNRAGEAEPLDVSLIIAQQLEAEVDLMTTHREREVAEVELARVLGLSRHPMDWTLKDELPRAAPLPVDDEALVQAALSERAEVRIAALEVRRADAEAQRQVLARWPQVAVGLQAERTERRALPGRDVLADTARATVAGGQLSAPSIQSRAQRNLIRRQFIDALLGPSLQITLPIWDQNQAQEAKALLIARQRRKDAEDLLDGIAREVQRAATLVRSAADLAHFFDDRLLSQSRSSVEIARRVYQSGGQDIVPLLEAQTFLAARRRAYVNVLRDYAVAMTELERASGGRLRLPSTQPATAPASRREE